MTMPFSSAVELPPSRSSAPARRSDHYRRSLELKLRTHFFITTKARSTTLRLVQNEIVLVGATDTVRRMLVFKNEKYFLLCVKPSATLKFCFS